MSRERILPDPVQLMECNLCGSVYPMDLRYWLCRQAPHGPAKDCMGYFKPYYGEYPVKDRSHEDGRSVA